ncbi:M36 family metallopeptidase [Longispora sp. K20-0274]|uniref:M36 family metallopeptidase n=1 Tax=Longispora sp. K20-0274 TaxID=3088255 RepID=UPI00399A37C9
MRTPWLWRAAAAALLVGAALSAAPVSAAPPAGPADPPGPVGAPGLVPGDPVRGGDPGGRPGNYDARRVRPRPEAATARTGTDPVDIDPVTGTPRLVAPLDGYLTGPGRAEPATVALGYLRDHPDLFGLSPREVAALTLRREYTDPEGTHHLSFTQHVGAVPVFGNGVRAHVSRDGRLAQVDGSPVRLLPARLPAPRLTAEEARAAAARDVAGPGARSTRGAAGLVVFPTVEGPRLGWQVTSYPEGFLHVIDAGTGRVLFRRDLEQHDTGLAWSRSPGAARGGRQQVRDLTGPGWLPAGAKTLSGDVAHVYLDLDDDAEAAPAEEVRPSAPGQFHYPFHDVNKAVGAPCAASYPCTWDPAKARSWQANAAQNAVQLLYFAGVFHDHLAAAPIGFTRAAGNFDARDGDAVQIAALDGAATRDGLPDDDHRNNANMSTYPDGTPPRMRMYLFQDDPYVAANSGDVADIVYHEYTHGLSNRLVSDVNGVSTLGGLQATALGEAWSDWYAMDLLASRGDVVDTAADGEVAIGRYMSHGTDAIRTQPLDCRVGEPTKACPKGGYTYGRYARIAGRPESHADGEIWAETLWDLRTALGGTLARGLVTRAMELSPADPSFLDERNAILRADHLVTGGRNTPAIWKVFAARGMGWFAGTFDADDTAPVEDFHTPPPVGPAGTLSGTVTDAVTGKALPGATVVFGGHRSPFAGGYVGVAGGDGTYTVNAVRPGTYPAVFAAAPGYDRDGGPQTVAAGPNTRDWALRRDWASVSGGAAVTGFTGEDATGDGCGPAALLDQSLGSGWVTDAVAAGGGIEPRAVTFRLPDAVDVTEVTVDPAAACGVGPSGSVGDYRLETSADGVTWRAAASGHFGVADRNRPTPVPLAAGTGAGVRWLRFTMLGTQLVDAGGNCPGAFAACTFVSASELVVHGTVRP